MDRHHCTSLLAFLRTVPDPRKPRGKRYSWELLMAIVCCALLSGCSTGSAIADWAANHAFEVAAWLGIPLRAVPSHSTLRRALRYVDIEALQRQVSRYVGALGEAHDPQGTIADTDGLPLRAVAVDGKEVRGASAHGERVQLVSMVRHGSADTVAQRQVARGSSEITAVSELLSGRDLRGLVVTLDALHTQRATAQQILDQGGDYLMVVKQNQPTLYQDIDTLFQDSQPVAEADRQSYCSCNKGHGRLERRTLICSRELSGYLDWPGARQVAKRSCWRKDMRTGEESLESSYAVTSLGRDRAGARELERLWRGHWTIENRVHYVRDETLKEDRCQIRKGNAPWALAALKNALLAGLRHVGWSNIAEALRYYGASTARALAFICGEPRGVSRCRRAAAA